MQFAIKYVTVGYKIILVIFENKLTDKYKITKVYGAVSLVWKKKIPFSNLKNSEFEAFTSRLSILLKKRPHELTIFEKIDAFSENEETSCKYHTIYQLNKINLAKPIKKLSLVHLNISSLPYHFNELSELLNDLTIKFKIIGITD